LSISIALLIETRLQKLIGSFKKENVNLEKDFLSSWEAFERTCQKLALKKGHIVRLRRGVEARMKAMRGKSAVSSDDCVVQMS